MSSFLGGTTGPDGAIVFRADDIRLWPEWADHDGTQRWIPLDDPWVLDGYSHGWWPGGGMLDASGGEWLGAIRWDRAEITRGANGRAGFTGVIRDVWGTAVAGAVVKLFRTVDDSLVWSTTSATDGSYTLSTPFTDAHYLYSFKDDVIDTAGATVNTLIPA